MAAGTVPETIMRTRGELVGYIDGASAPGKLVHFAVGMILVPEGTGTTVLWSPITDANAPWFWIEQFHLGYEEMVTDVVDVPGLSIFRKEIDLKAMRIVRPDVEVQLVFENVTLLSVAAVNVRVSFRMLLGR